jgi:hypothetical protein
MKYKFTFPDGLTERDDQTDLEMLNGKTWVEFHDMVDEMLGQQKGSRDNPDDIRNDPDMGVCESCRLRRGTGMVEFLEGRPKHPTYGALDVVIAPDWIYEEQVASICRPCARKLGYTTNDLSFPARNRILALKQRLTEDIRNTECNELDSLAASFRWQLRVDWSLLHELELDGAMIQLWQCDARKKEGTKQ